MTDTAHGSGPSRPRRRAWRHPALIALGAALAIIVASFVPTVWYMRGLMNSGPSAAFQDAPWDADVAADGAVRALGLRLPGSTLSDAAALWHDSLQVALMVSRGAPATLEAAVDSARPGGIAGRIVLSAQASPQQLRRWQERAAKVEHPSPQTRRLTLSAEDMAEALRAPLTSIGFLPQARLDAQVVRRRFGEPAEVIVDADAREHWLYPQRGLAVMLDANGRDLLQFVPPGRFEALLRSPLRDAGKPRTGAAAAAALRTEPG